MKTKIVITLILVLLPVTVFILPLMQKQQPGGYSITTEKDPAFDQKIERVFIAAGTGLLIAILHVPGKLRNRHKLK